MDANVGLILSQANNEARVLFYQAQSLIEAARPKPYKLAWSKQHIISYGIGPKKMSEHFCYINVLPHRINLGFYYGSMLSDPHHLLEGTGKLLRHIKIWRSEQLKNTAVEHLIQAASQYLPRLQ